MRMTAEAFERGRQISVQAAFLAAQASRVPSQREMDNVRLQPVRDALATAQKSKKPEDWAKYLELRNGLSAYLRCRV